MFQGWLGAPPASIAFRTHSTKLSSRLGFNSTWRTPAEVALAEMFSSGYPVIMTIGVRDVEAPQPLRQFQTVDVRHFVVHDKAIRPVPG